MGPPLGSHVLHIGLLQGKHDKFFVFGTTRNKALILSMYYHLVDHYQVCSNDAAGAKIGSATGGTCFTKANIGKT